jgi:hypothetical protein
LKWDGMDVSGIGWVQVGGIDLIAMEKIEVDEIE